MPGFEVVGKRESADVLLVYLGIQAVETIARRLKQSGLPMVVVSANTSKEHAAQAVQAGVIGLVPQSAPKRELEAALRAAGARKLYLSPSLPAAARQFARRALGGERNPLDRLTERQRTILKLIAEGRNTKEIAHRLKVSVKTVEFHRVRLMNRLEIYNVPGLVRFAVRTGLVRFDG